MLSPPHTMCVNSHRASCSFRAHRPKFSICGDPGEDLCCHRFPGDMVNVTRGVALGWEARYLSPQATLFLLHPVPAWGLSIVITLSFFPQTLVLDSSSDWRGGQYWEALGQAEGQLGMHFRNLPPAPGLSIFSGGSVSKESACKAGDPGSIPGSGISPGEGSGSLLQDSCLENPMDRGVWWATYSPRGHKVSDMTE